MRPEIYWVASPRLSGRLAIMPRPRAGDWLDDEIAGWRAAGIDHVVSLLEPNEVRELGLEREAGLCRALEISFANFPIADRSVPDSRKAAFDLAADLTTRLATGKAVAIHCRAGIGRSSLIAACVLVAAGHTAVDAFTLLETARGLPVPDTDEQRNWVIAAAQ